MPRIVDYQDVLSTAQQQGLKSLYHNSGAFSFEGQAADAVHAVGWIGQLDPTIRPAALDLVRLVQPPYEQTMAAMAVRACQEVVPGPVWVLPKSHWAYELDFGSAGWMPQALREAGLDPDRLSGRNDGSAIEFLPPEAGRLAVLFERLLTHLLGSDFAVMFPGRDVLCTVHHHKQLWWTSPDAQVIALLQALVPPQ